MTEITKEKPCEYAEILGSDWYECGAYYCGVGCDKVVLDKNPDGTINVANCGLGESEE